MKAQMKQNTSRWIVDILVIALGLAMLDGGLFAILVTGSVCLLEITLLISSCAPRGHAPIKIARLLSRAWIPLILFVMCLLAREIITEVSGK